MQLNHLLNKEFVAKFEHSDDELVIEACRRIDAIAIVHVMALTDLCLLAKELEDVIQKLEEFGTALGEDVLDSVITKIDNVQSELAEFEGLQ